MRAVDRYELHEAIASGGTASVHLARLRGSVGFARVVAVKRLHPHFAREPDFVAMFLDEAHLAARIRHPNVVPIVDVVSEGDELFLVMDFVLGASLAACVRARAGKGLDLPIAAAIARDVLLALHAAHETRGDDGALLEIVHRDVSPQNVIVGADGHARVIDFGIARAIGRLQTTREGEIRGKAAYLAPEQVRTEALDRRTDVFAAGVVFWEALTGRRLFASDTPLGAMTRILRDVPPPPSKFVTVPPAVDAIVMRALEKDPGERYATAQEMAHALTSAVACASEQEVAAFVRTVGGSELADREARAREIMRSDADASALMTPGAGPDDVATLLERPRSRWRASAISIAALAAGSIVVAVYAQAHRARSSAPHVDAAITNASSPIASSPSSSVAAVLAMDISSSIPSPSTRVETSAPVVPLASHKPTSSASAAPSARATALRVDCNPPWEWVDTLSGPERRIKAACIATPALSARNAP